MNHDGSHNERRISHYWVGAPLLLLLLSVLRGVRSPNAWSITHYFVSYEEGFTKRGLLGEAARQLGSETAHSYFYWATFGYLVFFANVILLGMLIVQFCRSNHRWKFLVSMVFIAGPSVVFLAHTIGYAEQLGLLLTLVAMRLKRWIEKYLLTLVMCPILLLVHEAHLFLFYPVILFELWVAADGSLKERRLVMAHGALCLLCALIVGSSTLSVADASRLYEVTQTKVDFALRADAYSTLHRNALDNLSAVWDVRWQGRTIGNLALAFLAMIAPAAYLLYALRWVSSKRQRLFSLAVGASVVPLLLHVLGWDEMRWNAIALCHLFLILCMVTRQYGADQVDNEPQLLASLRVFVAVALLSLFVPFPMFDGYRSSQNPVVRAIEYIKEVSETGRLIPGPRDGHRPGYKI